MRFRLAQALVLTLLGAWMIQPSAGSADHVSIQASVSAGVKEVRPSSVLVEVTYSINCIGAGAGGALYFGNLALVDVDTLEETPLGGVSSASGTDEVSVGRRDQVRRVRARMRASCADYDTFHGSGDVEVNSGEVVIPPKDGGGTGGGGGGGGDGGSGGPRDPLGPGGCVTELLGTAGPDELEGTPGGDLVLGLGGPDRIEGRAAHDCLIGGSGGDALVGEEGSDRLTGGGGGDSLRGGPGRNSYDAGPGRDRVKARNGRRERVDCGPGEDVASVDRSDRLHGCERVRRG